MRFNYIATGLLALIFSACTPTVQVAAPDKPIEINLNVNIEHRVKVQIDRDLDRLFEDKEGIF